MPLFAQAEQAHSVRRLSGALERMIPCWRPCLGCPVSMIDLRVPRRRRNVMCVRSICPAALVPTLMAAGGVGAGLFHPRLKNPGFESSSPGAGRTRGAAMWLLIQSVRNDDMARCVDGGAVGPALVSLPRPADRATAVRPDAILGWEKVLEQETAREHCLGVCCRSRISADAQSDRSLVPFTASTANAVADLTRCNVGLTI
jgi:hypothetical protein